MIPDICLPINYDVQERETLRIRSTQFGENYEQTSEDGLNSRLQEFDLTTLSLTDFQAERFLEVMRDLKGGPFYWVNPRTKRRETYKVSPNVFTKSYISNKWVQIKFKIKLVPSVEP
jgi:phage-related protein